MQSGGRSYINKQQDTDGVFLLCLDEFIDRRPATLKDIIMYLWTGADGWILSPVSINNGKGKGWQEKGQESCTVHF